MSAPFHPDSRPAGDEPTGEAKRPKFARQAAWRSRNPKKIWAHMALHSAMRRGLVQRQPCEVCGDPVSDAHHRALHAKAKRERRE